MAARRWAPRATAVLIEAGKRASIDDAFADAFAALSSYDANGSSITTQPATGDHPSA